MLADDGHTYERASIEEWFGMGFETSPTTNLRLKSTKLIPNIEMKKSIEEFYGHRAKSPEQKVKTEGYNGQDDDDGMPRQIYLCIYVHIPCLASQRLLYYENHEIKMSFLILGRSMSVAGLLSQHTSLPIEDQARYVSLLKKAGAASLEFLTDAQYTRDDLLRIGVHRPHVVCMHTSTYVSQFT